MLVMMSKPVRNQRFLETPSILFLKCKSIRKKALIYPSKTVVAIKKTPFIDVGNLKEKKLEDLPTTFKIKFRVKFPCDVSVPV